MSFEAFQSHLHGMVVHFPIALLFVSVGLEAAALYKPWREKLQPAALVLLVLGTISAAAAVVTGPEENYRGVSALGRIHEQWAQITLFWFGLLTLWRLYLFFRHRMLAARSLAVYLVLGALGVGMLGYTGYLGGTMVYEQAVGVRQGGRLVAPPAPRRPRTDGQRRDNQQNPSAWQVQVGQ